jgi:hypothetical protein
MMSMLMRRRRHGPGLLIQVGWGFLPIPGEGQRLRDGEARYQSLLEAAIARREAEQTFGAADPHGFKSDFNNSDSTGHETPNEAPNIYSITSGALVSPRIEAHLSWRSVAGNDELEPVFSRIEIPEPIVDATAGRIDSRFRIYPDGPPSDFQRAVIELDVSADFARRVYIVDESGSTRQMIQEGEALIGEIPRGALRSAVDQEGRPIYTAALRIVVEQDGISEREGQDA